MRVASLAIGLLLALSLPPAVQAHPLLGPQLDAGAILMSGLRELAAFQREPWRNRLFTRQNLQPPGSPDELIRWENRRVEASFDIDGVDVDSVDVESVDVDSHDVAGVDIEGVDVDGVDVEGVDVESVDTDGVDVEPVDIQSVDIP